ncbi:MAG TPA: clostripain-related cysteine peptidase [Bacteroidota bacterium]|nr:clostripain-related cysteine peptidase [Bacteroidota bacterium]
MKRHPIRSSSKAFHIMGLCAGVCCLLVGAVVLSCSSGDVMSRDVKGPDAGGNGPLRYLLVYFIHGDGEYLYHDSHGVSVRADEVTVAEARRIAEQQSSAEVFIFHAKPKRHTLFVFPKSDGEMFYYRHGILAGHEEYRRGVETAAFARESELYRRYLGTNRDTTARIFLYFGHEVPEFDGEGYDASYEDRPFTVDTLAAWLRELTGGRRKFDCVVLSTCYNGTPYIVSSIAPYARYIVASPDNLHLSYFSIHSLGQLPDSATSDASIAALTNTFARSAFETLVQSVQTAVSVAVYDASRVQPYLRSVGAAYERSFDAVKQIPETQRARCDCAGIREFERPDMATGVEILYRPPRFGQSKYTTGHSGWECWRIGNTP